VELYCEDGFRMEEVESSSATVTCPVELCCNGITATIDDCGILTEDSGGNEHGSMVVLACAAN